MKGCYRVAFENRRINLRIDIDPSVSEPEVIIRTNEETALVKEIVSFLKQHTEQERSTIAVYRGNIATEADQADIIRIYSEGRKMIVWTTEGEYQARCTLRELEETLDADWFLRISRSEIINLNWVSGFDMSFKGTIKVVFEDGSYSWVSRRYVGTVERRLADLAGSRRGRHG